MKKVIIFACGLLLALNMVGVAGALTFTNTQTLNATLGEGPVAQFLGLSNSITYQHTTPSDFQVPWDVVNSASLTIAGYWIDGDNDPVNVQGTAVGTLNPGGSYGSFWLWSWDKPSLSNFDIASTFTSWTTGSLLDVTITANGGFPDWTLELSSSTFILDYVNESAPVPEPGTMVLLGAGLLGMAIFGKRRMNNA